MLDKKYTLPTYLILSFLVVSFALSAAVVNYVYSATSRTYVSVNGYTFTYDPDSNIQVREVDWWYDQQWGLRITVQFNVVYSTTTFRIRAVADQFVFGEQSIQNPEATSYTFYFYNATSPVISIPPGAMGIGVYVEKT